MRAFSPVMVNLRQGPPAASRGRPTTDRNGRTTMPQPRFTVEPHRIRRGYTLRDRVPRLQFFEDVEGVGLVTYDPPKHLSQTFGWYRYRRDAEARARILNAAAA